MSATAYCDGSCVDALGNTACCDICLAERCRCGHSMGQHEYGAYFVPCLALECPCQTFQPAAISDNEDNNERDGVVWDAFGDGSITSGNTGDNG